MSRLGTIKLSLTTNTSKHAPWSQLPCEERTVADRDLLTRANRHRVSGVAVVLFDYSFSAFGTRNPAKKSAKASRSAESSFAV